MKNILYTIFICSWMVLLHTPVQAQKKEARFEKEFQKTLALVNSDRFMVKFYIATPTVQTLFTPPGAGENVDINPKQCYLWIKDSLVGAKLPYFGPTTWSAKSRLDSISVQQILFSRTVKLHEESKKKSIAYQITVLSENDIYHLNMDIEYDGTCYLYFSDRRRAPISYVGQIIPLPKTGK